MTLVCLMMIKGIRVKKEVPAVRQSWANGFDWLRGPPLNLVLSILCLSDSTEPCGSASCRYLTAHGCEPGPGLRFSSQWHLLNMPHDSDTWDRHRPTVRTMFWLLWSMMNCRWKFTTDAKDDQFFGALGCFYWAANIIINCDCSQNQLQNINYINTV